MKYAFFGSPEFAAIVLEKLIKAGMPPTVVVCSPDRPVGRKQIVTPPRTKMLIEQYDGISTLQPEKLDWDFQKRIASFNCDFFVVAAYAKIIPREILAIPQFGAIGVHPSLLPKYRGASPIQSAILSGEQDNGTTLYLMDEKMDHGPILAQARLEMKSPKHLEFQKKLAELSGDLLVETIPKFLKGALTPKNQNEKEVTVTKKFATEDGFISEADLKEALAGKNIAKAITIDRKIRGLNPSPGAWTMQKGKRVKLLEATLEDRVLKLKKVQEEGGKPKAI